MTRDITFAILRTSAMTEEKIQELYPEALDGDIQNLAKIYALMDGQKAFLLPALDGDDGYTYCGVADNKTQREINYLFEQDSETGAYIGQREEFERVYDAGEYDRDGMFALEKELVEIISPDEWLALARAEEGGAK